MSEDLSSFSMAELFRIEAETQSATLTEGLLALERDPTQTAGIEALMRAAHSLKGAARIVNIEAAVRVAHVMEDCFVAAQNNELTLARHGIDVLLRGVDLLTRIAQTPEASLGSWDTEKVAEIDAFIAELGNIGAVQETLAEEPVATTEGDEPSAAPGTTGTSSRVLRVTADNLNRLLGLAGESLVESRWLQPFGATMRRLKKQQIELAKSLGDLRDSLAGVSLSEQSEGHLKVAQQKIAANQEFLADRLVELEMFDRRSANLSHRLYREALSCRMRPFADGIHGFPRMVRDLARSLGKEVKLEIVGESTQVDRDILEKLEAPLSHLLRNAVDHAIESPDERRAAGKPAQGTVRIEARHSAGRFLVSVSDDGRGIDLDVLRLVIVEKKLTSSEVAEKLSEEELLEFLFLPGFTMKKSVTEISGRGVGLDVVQNMIKGVHGTVRISSQHGQGARFQLQLPLTLSVVRSLLVEIAGEPYAFPIAYINRTLRLARSQMESLEGRQHFLFDKQQIGIVSAHQVLGLPEPKFTDKELSVVVFGTGTSMYGLVVDRFLEERQLVVQALDSRLGKIKDISAGALMQDGTPVLIVDVEDMIRSIEKLVSGGSLTSVRRDDGAAAAKKRKRVLVVDDSLTVRELERKLLAGKDYEVDVAVDGMDGWNAVRTGHYDLLVTDVDMPRMDGIELVTLVKKDPNLKSLPAMIVSYKDRDEDRRRGLEAGADYYLTKGSFHDETLLQAVADLIGEAKE